MPAHRIHWSWSPAAQEGAAEGREDRAQGGTDLRKRLHEVAMDRAASARAVTAETAGLVGTWLRSLPGTWGQDRAQAGNDLEFGLQEWSERQGWRGSCANFLEGLREGFHAASAPQLRAVLLGELEDRFPTQRGDQRGQGLAEMSSSRRGAHPDPGQVAPHALRTLRRNESLMLYGYSETVLTAVRAAQRAGFSPEVSIAVGSPDQSGKRMARRLNSDGVRVRLLWDTAAISSVEEVDQVWLGAEAIGSASFVALVGTESLMAAARSQEVPVSVLCTAEDLMPEGATELPAWGDAETWTLWSHGPEAVDVQSQPFEVAPSSGVRQWITEAGPETLADLCTRAMRTRTNAPCTRAGA